MKVVVQDRQNLADIALQTCGSIEAVFAIAEQNGLSITADLTVGQVLDYDLSDVQNKQVVSTYKADNVLPAGMVPQTLVEELKTMEESQNGIDDIRDASDPATPEALTNIFTSQFNIQFA